MVCTGETNTDHADLGIHLPDLYHPDQAARRLDRSIPVQIAAAVVYTNTYRDRSVGLYTISTHTTMGSLYTHTVLIDKHSILEQTYVHRWLHGILYYIH